MRDQDNLVLLFIENIYSVICLGSFSPFVFFCSKKIQVHKEDHLYFHFHSIVFYRKYQSFVRAVPGLINKNS